MNDWADALAARLPDIVEPSSLGDAAAKAMARLAGSDSYEGGRLVECRVPRHSEGCLVVVDIEVPLGQREPVNDIRPIERIGFFYLDPLRPCGVHPLRVDFPEDLPHLNIAMDGDPRSLCLFEMPQEDVLRIATPFVLLERTRLWMKETAYGRLHGDDQPLDPFFANSGLSLVLPPREALAADTGIFRCVKTSRRSGAPTFLIPNGSGPNVVVTDAGIAAIAVTTAPLRHARIRMLPRDMAELFRCFDELGVDLAGSIGDAIAGWFGKPNLGALLELNCLIVVNTPIEREPGRTDGHATKAFLTSCTGKQLGQALGVLFSEEGIVGRALIKAKPNLGVLATVSLTPMDVFEGFDRTVARAASGLAPLHEDPSPLTLVGAGALGSQLAMSAARMGIGRWTIIDPDHLMPHNLARHAMAPNYLGWAKADAMAVEIRHLLGPDAATPVVARIGDGGGDDTIAALAETSLVIDASASVPTARWLATRSSHGARMVSVFLSPSGRDLVILWEGPTRTPRIDHVEMAYYKMLAEDGRLEGHLGGGGAGLFPSGGCRTPSMRLSQADVAMFSGIAVKRILVDRQPAGGLIEVRRSSNDGVVLLTREVVEFTEALIDGFTVSVADDVLRAVTSARTVASEFETGGILVGSWDRIEKSLYIVMHLDPPPDSDAQRAGFVRGMDGVYRTLEHLESSTAGNLTYVGEWHTHPLGHDSGPSGDDRILMEWIDDVLLYSDVPACMMIVGHDGVRLCIGSTAKFAIFSGGSR
jgi:hypothetical protein